VWPHPTSTLFPYTTLFRSNAWRRRMRKSRQQGPSSIEPEAEGRGAARGLSRKSTREEPSNPVGGRRIRCAIYTRESSEEGLEQEDRKSTRLNSSHVAISYA